MLPSPLFQLLSAVLFLVLRAGNVLADSGSVPLTIHPQNPRFASCSKGKGLLGSSCSSIVDHKTYCNRYMVYCNSFTVSIGDVNDRDGYSAYCSQNSRYNSCRQFASKGTTSTTASTRAPTSTKSQGNRRGYQSSPNFNIRDDDATGNITAGNLDVDTSNNVWYAVEITLGGQNFTVQLDTGSSDLWLHTAHRPVQLTNTTDLVTSETYGPQHVEGTIKFADLHIGELTIERQAFLQVSDADVHGFDLTSYDGILGMAFDVGSIHSKVEQEWGAEAANHLAHSPMTALFANEPTLPNNFDLQLSRPVAELDDTASGLLMISSHAPGYENVVNAPRLPRAAPQHWSVVMDAMLVNGQSFSFNQSRIARVPAGKIVAALDTGSSFPALPLAAIDAIYGSVPGAVYDNISEAWLVPCDRSPNVTFVFGGQQFPMHPLDLTFPVTATLPINARWNMEITACVNTFQYLTTDPTSSDGFDIILADAFLHNVYASFDYGDWNPRNNTDGTPFVQMVSITDSATMWADFYANRTAALAQLPLPLDPALIVQYEAGSTPTAPASPASTSSSGPTQSPDTLANLSGAVSTDETSSAGDDSWGNKYGKVMLALLGANLVVGVALLVVTVTMCVRRRKERSGPGGSRYAPVQFKEPVEDYGRGSVVSSD